MAKRKTEGVSEDEGNAKWEKLNQGIESGNEGDLQTDQASMVGLAADVKLDTNAGSVADGISTPKRASLLGLPAELRNQILDEVLLPEPYNDEHIVSRTNPSLPGVLRTCRLLRNEGTEKFAINNTLVINAMDLKLEPHPKHWVFTVKDVDHIYIEFTGAFSKLNLMDWLYRYFEDPQTLRFEEGDSAQDYDDTITQAFDIVDNLRRCGSPWWVVEGKVEGFMEGVKEGSRSAGVDFEWDD